MGHIELAVPVAHIWFFKTLPRPMGNLIDITLRDLEKVIYYSSYVVIEPGKQEVEANQLLDEDEYLDPARRRRGRRATPPSRPTSARPRCASCSSGSTSTSWPTSCAPAVATETQPAPQEADAQAAQDRRRVPQLGRLAATCRNKPGVDDPGRDPGDSARPAAAGAARRRPLRHVRPERSVSPRHQPQQPAHRS